MISISPRSLANSIAVADLPDAVEPTSAKARGTDSDSSKLQAPRRTRPLKKLDHGSLEEVRSTSGHLNFHQRSRLSGSVIGGGEVQQFSLTSLS